MLTRFQVMAITTAVQRLESQALGDTCLTLQLGDVIREAVKEMEYYHDDPLDALKQAESHLTDAINMLDQANDRTGTTRDLEKNADKLMGELQKLIRYMEHEPEEDPDQEAREDDGLEQWIHSKH